MLKKNTPDIIQGYLEDSSNLSGGYAQGLYIPENEKDIVEILQECHAKNTPLTVSAGQTGTTGGCIPFGGWLLSTQKLNKIITVNPAGKYAVVQPGVTLEEIDAAVKKEGLLYPPDPTEKKAMLGGNVSTNASGGRGYRFGSTRDWIRRLKVILPSGEMLDLKRGGVKPSFPIPNYKMPATKNSAGYFSKTGMDLIDLFIGAEGTLGIVNEIEIALAPVMDNTVDLVAFFPDENRAVDFVIKNNKGNDSNRRLYQSTINFFEFFDDNTLQMLKKSYPHIPSNAKAAIYIEQETDRIEDWVPRLEEFGASIDTCWVGMDDAQKEELAKFRHAVPEHINEIFKQHHSIKLATDIAVPADKFKEMFHYYNNELSTFGGNDEIMFIKFGHIGENHLHVNLVPKTEKDIPLAKELILRFVKKAVSLGGTVSAEHGIGKIKHAYLKEMYGQDGINEMERVKRIFDPHWILGKGNIFPLPPHQK
ncbi:MAG: FAD-binding oxidoreductase [Candidatus Margulisiibacteriota bacterium]